MTIRHPQLFPHTNGIPNLTAYGKFALLYRHPHDLHFIPIFDQVSVEFVQEYVRTREWCREAADSGWEFACCPSDGINMEGATIQ
jgi:hypothetical protein